MDLVAAAGRLRSGGELRRARLCSQLCSHPIHTLCSHLPPPHQVISAEHATSDGLQAAAAKVKALKGSRSLKLLQQYGLVLATYNEAPPAPPPSTLTNSPASTRPST